MSEPAGSSPAEDERGAEGARSPAASSRASRAAGAAAGGGSDEPPPVLGRWSRLYALVVLELLVVILALYWLTRRFA